MSRIIFHEANSAPWAYCCPASPVPGIECSIVHVRFAEVPVRHPKIPRINGVLIERFPAAPFSIHCVCVDEISHPEISWVSCRFTTQQEDIFICDERPRGGGRGFTKVEGNKRTTNERQHNKLHFLYVFHCELISSTRPASVCERQPTFLPQNSVMNGQLTC